MLSFSYPPLQKGKIGGFIVVAPRRFSRDRKLALISQPSLLLANLLKQSHPEYSVSPFIKGRLRGIYCSRKALALLSQLNWNLAILPKQAHLKYSTLPLLNKPL